MVFRMTQFWLGLAEKRSLTRCHRLVGHSCMTLLLIVSFGLAIWSPASAQETTSAQETKQGEAKETSSAKELELTGSTPVDALAKGDRQLAGTDTTTPSPTAAGGLLSVSKASILVGSLTVFLLSVFVGFEVIAKVPPTLHTPLMSGSNAISGITVIGAILTAGSVVGGFGSLLGLFAIVLAMINVVGGFLVTHRMLMMFKKR